MKTVPTLRVVSKAEIPAELAELGVAGVLGRRKESAFSVVCLRGGAHHAVTST